MRIVKFPLVQNDGVVVYPDDISLFSDTEIVGTDIIAGYTGALALEDGAYPLPPEPPEASYGTKITRLALRNRLTVTERIAMETAKASDPLLRVLLDDLANSEYVDLTYQPTIDGLGYMATQGILTAERVAEILTAPVTLDELPGTIA